MRAVACSLCVDVVNEALILAARLNWRTTAPLKTRSDTNGATYCVPVVATFTYLEGSFPTNHFYHSNIP